MTPQLADWLGFDIPYSRDTAREACYRRLLPAYWCVRLVWHTFRGQPMAVEGFGASTEAAELAALEEYAKRIFVPGALKQGRKAMGLR